ncbi:hypothetical protein PYCCODRAFT_1465338 [Trametes coccinea BRFM310]|uniref:F-box domain-containing protein n=1 Tax=Trametes coccinea (strain BRFM310) TaxID=1353009 RepID=A0A1Y2IXS2_TRAC3|nr:hypothetical protein PYCCODRAFT_1465338 [Trametes coccinea BRFM310]
MPLLTAVRNINTMAAGVLWMTQEAILSHPQLRIFDIEGTLYRQFGPETVNVAAFTAAPLTSYKQVVDDFCILRYSPADSLLLCVVLHQLQVQESLERFEVPSKLVPLALITEQCGQWPRLRRVVLHGEKWQDGRAVIELLNQMATLEELVFTLAHSTRSDLHQICPPNWTGPLLWPRLKTLSLTYPDPLDPVYAWLPATLRRLMLRCWPYHYNFDSAKTWRTVEDFGWDLPIHDSSAMLNILRQCRCSQLDSLEIEFVAGPEDTQLLQLIAAAFPELSSLTVYRYMPWCLVDGVTQGVVWQALRPLQHLWYLSIYLDYIETAPLYFGNTHLGSFSKSLHYIARARVSSRFEQLAGSIARSLGPALSVISLLQGVSTNEWVLFWVERTDDGGCLVWLAPDALDGYDFV